MVAVAHPNLLLGVQAMEQDAVRALDLDGGLAILPVGRTVDDPAGVAGQQLLSVAHAQDRHAQLQDGRVQVRGACLQHGFRPAGQDDAAQVGALDLRGGGRGPVDQAERAQVPQPAGDQAGVLGPVVENGDAFVVHGNPIILSNSRIPDAGRHCAFLKDSSVSTMIQLRPSRR